MTQLTSVSDWEERTSEAPTPALRTHHLLALLAISQTSRLMLHALLLDLV